MSYVEPKPGSFYKRPGKGREICLRLVIKYKNMIYEKDLTPFVSQEEAPVEETPETPEEGGKEGEESTEE